MCLGRFSAVTFQVLGHTKTILVLLISWLVLHEHMSGRKMLGMALAVAGMVAYGHFNNKAAAAAKPAETLPLLNKQRVTNDNEVRQAGRLRRAAHAAREGAGGGQRTTPESWTSFSQLPSNQPAGWTPRPCPRRWPTTTLCVRAPSAPSRAWAARVCCPRPERDQAGGPPTCIIMT